MADLGLDNLVHQTLNLEILTSPQVQEIWTTLGTQNVTQDEFLAEAVRKGFLTSYQVERLKRGDTTGYYFGDYKVLYHIGSGTFARVYRATHKTSGKIVALKVLRSNFDDDQGVIDHFIHEAELGIELRHPNIVPIFEVQSHPGEHFMVMDFIEGQTLRELLRMRGKIEPKVATKFVTDICSGLDYAARRHLQHRDLKLSNVLLSNNGRAMLVDFGLATIAENSSIGNAEIRNQRSIDYAALERITNVPRDDNRSDIYFLGCIFYHLLTGEPPLLETRDRAKRLNKNRFTSVRPIQNVDPMIPRAVILVINKAMSLDVERRYQTMAELGLDLEICAKRLTDGTANDGIMPSQIDTGLARMAANASREKQKSIMIVDADTKLQEVFRDSFKKSGYRVLVASSSDRAVDRLFDDITVANLVIFNIQSLGPAGVEGWTRLAKDAYSSKLPSIMLLDERQTEWIEGAETDDIHTVLMMPIKMKDLKAQVAQLLLRAEEATAPTEPFTPKFELQMDLFQTLDLFPANEEQAEQPSDIDAGQEFEEDEEEIEEPSDVHIHQAHEYKAILAEAKLEEESFADALFDANVPELISDHHRAGSVSERQEAEIEDQSRDREGAEEPEETQEFQEHVESEQQPEEVDSEDQSRVHEEAEYEDQSRDRQEAEDSEPVQEHVEPESEPEPESLAGEASTLQEPEPQPEPEPQHQQEVQNLLANAQSLEEFQSILDNAKSRFEEATREENEISERREELANRKRETEEKLQATRELLGDKQLQLEMAQTLLANHADTVESNSAQESEFTQLLEETTKSKEQTASNHAAAKENLERTHSEIQQRQEDHRQLDERVQMVRSLAEGADDFQMQLEEFQKVLAETEANLERLQNESNDALSAAGEAHLNSTQLAEKIEALTMEHAESTSTAQSVQEESEAAASIIEELKTNSETLQQKAEESLQAAVEKETLAQELEEEARKAVERAELARKEANEAMAAAEETQIQAETAAEEFQAAQQFADETAQKLEQANAKVEEHHNSLQSLREEHERLTKEAEQHEENAVNLTLELERITEERDATRQLLEETQTSHASASAEKENLPQLLESLEQLTAEVEQLQLSANTAQEELEKLTLESQEISGLEEELRIQIEKLREETEQAKTQSEEATQLAELAQKEYDEILLQQQREEEELQSFSQQESELNRLSGVRIAYRESAQRAVEDAEKALNEFRAGSVSERDDQSRAREEAESDHHVPEEETSLETAASEETTTHTQQEPEPAEKLEAPKSEVGDRVAAAIRARVEAALAARKK